MTGLSGSLSPWGEGEITIRLALGYGHLNSFPRSACTNAVGDGVQTPSVTRGTLATRWRSARIVFFKALKSICASSRGRIEKIREASTDVVMLLVLTARK